MKRYIKELQVISIYYLFYGKELGNAKKIEAKGYTIKLLCECLYGNYLNKPLPKLYANFFRIWIDIYDKEQNKCLSMEFGLYNKEDDKSRVINNKIEDIYKYIKEYEKDLNIVKSSFKTNPQFIHQLYLDILVKLDQDIKLQKEKDGIDLKRDKKVCLLLSKLIRELYGEEIETDSSYIFGTTKKECFKILKETILPSLDYKIDDDELNKVIEECSNKLALKNEDK